MATQHLDLDEQEQIANLKHFWKKWGLFISGALTVAALAFAGTQFWSYWQTSQAQKSALLFDELSRAVVAGDVTKTDLAFKDMKERFGSTSYTAQAALLDARMNYEKGNVPATEAALQWLVDSSVDASYRDIARLRLSGVWLEGKKYEEAIKLLSTNISSTFLPLAADRLGDAYVLQGKPDLAKQQYRKAYAGLDVANEYRRMVEVKLASLGVDAAANANTPAIEAK